MSLLSDIIDGTKLVARALVDRNHPILAQIVPMRRCNLACAYCNEFDKVSEPVPFERSHAAGQARRAAHRDRDALRRRADDPSEVDEIRRHALARDGRRHHHERYFLQPERIERLNEAGLQYLQISIDNVQPDEVSRRACKILDSKLENLASTRFQGQHQLRARQRHQESRGRADIAKRAKELGFSTTVGMIHDGTAICSR